ncbi:hypothetical protein V1478_009266 [Vespula squamosa]|uniref:Uncharacterized protein n=1 Tax=Vespula squamosa TaxID=30214 RepID=A0ABD2AP59_VESSQ
MITLASEWYAIRRPLTIIGTSSYLLKILAKMSGRLRRGNEAPFKREYKTLKRSVRRRLTVETFLYRSRSKGSINLFIFAHLSVAHPGYWSGAAESKSAPMAASSSF